MTEQAVTETTNDVAPQTSEDVSELDSLLEEFNEPEPEKAKPSPEVTKNDLKDFIAKANAKEEREFRQSSEQGVRESAQTLAKTLDLGFDDAKNEKVAKGLLLNAAEEDPRVAKAFANRNSNPTGWNKILESIGKEFGEGRVDTNATGSHDALRQSLTKGGKISQTEDNTALNKKIDGMSDQEFEQYKASL